MSKLDIPNHTQIPNLLIDELMSELNGSELKVLLAICRKTIGWHKKTDKISLSQLMKLTGLTRKTVTVAIPELEKRKLISVDRSGKTNEYDINYGSVINTPPVVEKLHQASEKNTPSDSEKITHTKETVTKDTLTKESSAPPRVDPDLVPAPLNSIPGFKDKFELYYRYMKEQHSISLKRPAIEAKLNKLLHLQKEGEDVLAVIDQTIGGINKAFFPVRNFDNSNGAHKKNGQSEAPDYTGVANASMYRDPDE